MAKEKGPEGSCINWSFYHRKHALHTTDLGPLCDQCKALAVADGRIDEQGHTASPYPKPKGE